MYRDQTTDSVKSIYSMYSRTNCTLRCDDTAYWLTSSLKMAYVDESGAVSWSQVVQHGRLVEIGQVRHVLDLLKLRRIHLLDLILLYRLLLQNTPM